MFSYQKEINSVWSRLGVVEVNPSSLRSSDRLMHYYYFKFECNDISLLSINMILTGALVYYFYTYNRYIYTIYIIYVCICKCIGMYTSFFISSISRFRRYFIDNHPTDLLFCNIEQKCTFVLYNYNKMFKLLILILGYL